MALKNYGVLRGKVIDGKVDGMSYTAEQASREGWVIVF